MVESPGYDKVLNKVSIRIRLDTITKFQLCVCPAHASELTIKQTLT